MPQNGIFLEVGETDASWNIAKGGSITETKLQSNAWGGTAENGIIMGALDGADTSLPTIDFDVAQIMWTDFEWLGVGLVWCGFVIDGVAYQVCEFPHSNVASFDSVYMRTANLPLNYSIYQSGTGAGTLDHICSTVITEGGLEETGITREHNNAATVITLASTATVYGLLGITLPAGKQRRGCSVNRHAESLARIGHCMGVPGRQRRLR